MYLGTDQTAQYLASLWGVCSTVAQKSVLTGRELYVSG
jgi:hypothetical protein